LGSSSFGLQPSDKENLILEPYFLMKFHGGVSWDEMYDMPVTYKDWFIKRLTRELESQNSSTDTAVGPTTPQRRINFQQLQKAFSGGEDR